VLGLDEGKHVGLIGKQFGMPSGVLGRIAARFMARSNRDFNQQLVKTVAASPPRPAVVAELGFGPGVGLAALLDAFPDAQVLGADPSPAVMHEAQARNQEAVRSGRLRLFTGDAGSLRGHRPIDLVVAVHVLYFWHDAAESLRQVKEVLSHDGRLVLGYQLQQDMPPPAQRDFPKEGHRLYESDEAVGEVLLEAGFTPQNVTVLGRPEAPLGRILTAQSS
jgi:SAM-dependent methyltransferase